MELLEKLAPILTVKQIDRLSNIFDNAGQVVFGVIVLSPIIAGFDRVNLLVVLSGLVGMIICWIASVLLLRKETL